MVLAGVAAGLAMLYVFFWPALLPCPGDQLHHELTLRFPLFIGHLEMTTTRKKAMMRTGRFVYGVRC
jgi:hypothetical protein